VANRRISFLPISSKPHIGAKIQNQIIQKLLLAAVFSKMRNVTTIMTQHRRCDAIPPLYSNP
jgi:hypothetical protein